MKFPIKKHISVLTSESAGITCHAEIGSAGCSKKLGRGPVNWKTDRKNRYTVIGAQNMGTTYHSVRVHI